MNAKELLSLSAQEIADEVIKKNGSKKCLTDFITEGAFDEDQFDVLVEVNECILLRSSNERQRYCDLTLPLVQSKQMWSEQEFRLIDALSLCNSIFGDTEYYRSRVRELIISLYEKDLLISVDDSKDPFIVSEQKKRPMILAAIKQAFPNVSTKKIPQRLS